jgi:hypothetical protein
MCSLSADFPRKVPSFKFHGNSLGGYHTDTFGRTVERDEGSDYLNNTTLLSVYKCLLTKAVILGTQHFRIVVSGVRRNDKVLLALLNLYVPIKIRVATSDANRNVTDSTQDNQSLLQTRSLFIL